MDLYSELGKTIKKAREERGVTQQQLADAIGLNRVSVANIESGNHHPPFHYVVRLSDELGFEISDLVSAYRKSKLDVAVKKQSKELGININAILASKGKAIESKTEIG